MEVVWGSGFLRQTVKVEYFRKDSEPHLALSKSINIDSSLTKIRSCSHNGLHSRTCLVFIVITFALTCIMVTVQYTVE